MQSIVVYDENTSELLACIPLQNMGKSIAKTNIAFSYYDKSEPMFYNEDGIVKVNHNACMIKLGGD